LARIVWRCAEPIDDGAGVRFAEASSLPFLPCDAAACFFDARCFSTGAASSALATGALA
jgi:hypothetical protein